MTRRKWSIVFIIHRSSSLSPHYINCSVVVKVVQLNWNPSLKVDNHNGAGGEIDHSPDQGWPVVGISQGARGENSWWRKYETGESRRLFVATHSESTGWDSLLGVVEVCCGGMSGHPLLRLFRLWSLNTLDVRPIWIEYLLKLWLHGFIMCTKVYVGSWFWNVSF